MAKSLTIGLIKDNWMMDSDSMQHYAQMAVAFLAGKEINTGLFSSLKLPDVPDSIALIPIAGALTKDDVCGWTGTRSLAMMVAAAADNPAIEGIILYFENCPGGQVDGTQYFADEITKAKQKKPVLAAVSGGVHSAGVWLSSQCTEVYATSKTDFIGCIGVMGRLRNPKTTATESADYIEIISDFSPDKNAESQDPSLYKERLLNPLALIFQDAVKTGRGSKLKLKKENVLTGKTYIAKEAQEFGLIDGIMPFDIILKRTISLAKTISK